MSLLLLLTSTALTPVSALAQTADPIDLTSLRQPWGTRITPVRTTLVNDPGLGVPFHRRQVNVNVSTQAADNDRQDVRIYQVEWRDDLVKSEADEIVALIESGHYGGKPFTINTPPDEPDGVPSTMDASLVTGSLRVEADGAQNWRIRATFRELN